MDDPSSNTPTNKKGRGGTLLKDLTRNRSSGHKKSIQFDELTGVAIGPNKNRFRSFVGVLGQSKGSILKERWKDVAGDIKDKIWDTIMETFDVPNTKLLKKKWLAYAGVRWRGFKTYLTSKYIFGELSDKSPCEKYTFLDEETWQTFVKSRMELSFQEKRNKAKVLQAKNVYPHRLSHGGYELLEEKMIQEKEQQHREASQLDPSSLVDPPSPPERHEKWKRARQKLSGDYLSEEAHVVAEKIKSLVEQCSQGTFVPHGRDDILATAIGRPEHPGRDICSTLSPQVLLVHGWRDSTLQNHSLERIFTTSRNVGQGYFLIFTQVVLLSENLLDRNKQNSR